MKILGQRKRSPTKNGAALQSNFSEMVGGSASFAFILSQVKQVAPLNTTILLLGEAGTGKSVVASAIYRRSARKEMPMVTINCAALPAGRIERELFGQGEGAITKGNYQQTGRFELADGGTLFLDEIDTVSLELQCKLLRVIQDGEFEQPGSPCIIKVDVRVIASSNRNLEEEIRAGRFREDLYYRLNVFPISIPPLREHKEDIPLLVNYFIAKFNQRTGKKIVTVANETLNTLQGYHWPGNVRELESVIERAVITSQGDKLQIEERFETRYGGVVQNSGEVKTLAELECEHILQVLVKTSWRIEGDKGAAILLGLNPSTLRARIRKLGIRRP
ncbi:MAG: sigma 54-interacting transcriptional regulator [Desulfuromonadales bacterium]|nr:sigma 54-interacting transcriptional regulator [Desulfuromonadales bacterium]